MTSNILYQKKVSNEKSMKIHRELAKMLKEKQVRLTPCFPGIMQCHTIRLTVPSDNISGFATKP